MFVVPNLPQILGLSLSILSLTDRLHALSPYAPSLTERQAMTGVDPASVPWWQYDPDQLYHARYHCWLSMAAYGDYDTVCPTVFTQSSLTSSIPNSNEAAWTPLGAFRTPGGLEGYQVIVPEMDKVVIVFKGMEGWEYLNRTPAPLHDALNIPCTNCTAHSGALALYLEAKAYTNDWAVAKQTVNQTGHKFSITGHGFGGSVALIAALDLGFSGNVHYSHSQGAPRVFNPAAAKLYDSLFQGESGQRLVANDDIVPTLIPESENYTFTGTGIHVWGQNSTYGMNFVNCWYNNENATCAGGNSRNDSYYYFTPIGQCGTRAENQTQVDALVSSMSSAFYATATNIPNLTTTTATSSSSSSSPASSAPATPSPSPSGAPAEGAAAASGSSSAAAGTKTGDAAVSWGLVGSSGLGMLGLSLVFGIIICHV